MSLIGPVGPNFLLLVLMKSCRYLTAVLVHSLRKFMNNSGKLERDCVSPIKSTIRRGHSLFAHLDQHLLHKCLDTQGCGRYF